MKIQTAPPPGRAHRIVGLDTLRFMAAAIVMFGHLDLLAVRYPGANAHGLAKLGLGIYNALFNGPAAVIVFFLVSGFCIHFPYRGSQRLAVPGFYARRFVRILGPAAAFMLVLRYVVHDKSSPLDTVLWSIFCETTYYLLYPALLFLRRRSSWALLTGASAAGAALLIATHVGELPIGVKGYIALGSYVWILGLPCWLLGCRLAETYAKFAVPSTLTIWSARAGIYLLTIALELARFHINSPLTSNCVLLDLFAVPVYFWLGMEIAYASNHAPSRLLEWAGSWSYSLYLAHPLVIPVLAVIGWAGFTTRNATHFLVFPLALVCAYVFHRVVERPSHLLAVQLSRRLKTRDTPRPAAEAVPSAVAYESAVPEPK
jgi:peptidoglycan/LPS O-acetylase OafA/YrhL